MAPAKPVHFTATADIATGGAQVPVWGFVLTPAAAAVTAVIREGGSGGAIVMSLQAAPNGASVVVTVPMAIRDPHVTLTGAGVLFTALI